MGRVTTQSTTRAGQILVLVAIVTMAFNLRTVAASLGAVLTFVRDDLGFSSAAAGLLVTIPVLCFAAFGSTTVALARFIGLHRTVLIAIVLIAVGSIARAWTDSQAIFWTATIAALIGSAIGNVLLPPLAKLHFAHRVTTISALFLATTVGGATAGAALTLPMTSWLGGWSAALTVWGAVAAAAIVPWILLAGRDTRRVAAAPGSHIPFRAVLRSRLAWAMAVFFALQSMQAYVGMGWMPTILIDLGVSENMAGLVIGLAAFMGVPIALALPRLLSWLGHTPVLPLTFAIMTAAGWMGVLFAPLAAPWLWGVMIGIGGGAFPWTIALIPVRARTVDGTAALSGFVQTVGYLIAALGPWTVGVLHELTGSWEPALIMLACVCVPFAVLGVYLTRAGDFEDTLPRGASST